MQRDKRKVEQALLKKGFEQDDTHHHFFLYRTEQGQLTSIRTRTSHSGKDLNSYLLNSMAKQCHLSKSEFLNLVDCPLSRTQYEKGIEEHL
jgi:predicted RNA binding protein YcfA (HicA-like mRNA interferase family)